MERTEDSPGAEPSGRPSLPALRPDGASPALLRSLRLRLRPDDSPARIRRPAGRAGSRPAALLDIVSAPAAGGLRLVPACLRPRRRGHRRAGRRRVLSGRPGRCGAPGAGPVRPVFHRGRPVRTGPAASIAATLAWGILVGAHPRRGRPAARRQRPGRQLIRPRGGRAGHGRRGPARCALATSGRCR